MRRATAVTYSVLARSRSALPFVTRVGGTPRRSVGQRDAGRTSSTTYGDPRNTFHEKAVLCRAAENTCYFATVNYAEAGSPTTSAVARPDGYEG